MSSLSEARLQQECFMHLHNQYPHMRGLFFRIKNEDHNRITGARNKATGVIPGVADSCLLLPLGHGGAHFIEFKTPEGRQSGVQKDWQSKVEGIGYRYFIIHSLDEFKSLCQQLGL